MRLSHLAVFPVKSLRGLACGEALVEPWGLAGDRRYAVVGPDGAIITQREMPAMALIQADITAAGLLLSHAAGGALAVATPGPAAPALTLTLWRDEIAAADAGEGAAAFLTAVLGRPCRLAYLADTGARALNPAYARPGAAEGAACETVSLADGFPVLLTTEASLADLNTRLPFPIPMLRFRPNLVVSGAAAWAEDGWRRIRIGAVVFRVAKPCDRCMMTTIDPETALRPNPVEPIRTLGRFRRDRRGGVMFGQNLVPENTGIVRVGDAVTVLEAGAPNVELE